MLASIQSRRSMSLIGNLLLKATGIHTPSRISHRRPFSLKQESTADSTNEKRDLKLWLVGYYSVESTSIRNAEALFRACMNVASRKAWHARCKVGEDWKSKHLLRTIYVWLVHKRMLREGESCKKLQQYFFDDFWSDTSIQIRNAGIDELFNTKSLKTVQEYSFELLLSFDYALTLPTVEEQLHDLAGALWGLLYGSPKVFSEADLMHFACHIYTELQTLYEIPFEKFKIGAIEFADAPDFSKPRKGNYVDLHYAELDGRDDIGEWRANLDVTGKIYYWNPRTWESIYEKPPVHNSSDMKVILK